jgi:2,5-diamino-6-(ribosylamino)-4(3H)-pyrimidinone 5'-phosphate reductase
MEMFMDRIPEEEPSDRVKPDRDHALPWWVIVDTGGSLKGLLHVGRQFELCRDVMVVVSNATPHDYLTYLEERNYITITSGPVKADFGKVFRILSKDYGVKTILVDSGSVLNSILLGRGLIDELSIIITPCLTGNRTQKLFDSLELSGKNITLRLKKAESFDNGSVLLNYRVVKKK